MALTPITQPEYVALIRTGGLAWPGDWVRTDRLIPLAFNFGQSSLGNASFALLPRKTIQSGQYITEDEITNGAYVGIARAESPTQPVWFGFITTMPELRFTANDDRLGQINALQIGNILDQVKLTNWLTVYGDETTTQRTDDPPQANFEISAGELIGNKIVVEIDGADSPVFAGSPSACGKADANYWTRSELLTHISLFTIPAQFNQISIVISPAADIDLADTFKENFIFKNATLRTALDALAARDRGYTWNITLGENDEWIINIDLVYDAASASVVDLTELNKHALKALTIEDNAGTQIDEIIVQGLPIVYMCTFENGKADTQSTPLYFRKGWSAQQETDYEAATREERTNAQYADVFQRFEFFDPGDDGTILTQQASNGQGTPVGACPQIDLNPLLGTPFADPETQRTPYFASARLNRVLPWAIGYGQTSDTRDQRQKTQPKYAPSMIFQRDASNNYTDLIKAWPAEFQQQSLDTGPDDRQLGIRIDSPYNHVLGLNTISDELGQPAIFDYRGLAFTVAFESSQLFSVKRLRQGVDQVRKQLIIKGDWQLWACHEGTIIGVDDNRDSIRALKTGPYSVNQNMGGGVFALRDDSREIIDALNEAEIWAFRDSKSGSIVLTDAGFEAPWAVPGASIKQILDRVTTDAAIDVPGGTEQTREVTYDVNAIVESVTVNCDVESPESVGTIINFGARNQISGAGFSKTIVNNPSTAQAANDLPRQLRTISSQIQSMPTTFGKGGGGGAQREIEIIDGQLLPPQNINGIKFENSALAPGIDDPNVPGIRANGIGRGRYTDNGQYIMIIHDTGSPIAVTTAHKSGDLGVSIKTLTVTVGPASTVYHYMGLF